MDIPRLFSLLSVAIAALLVLSSCQDSAEPDNTLTIGMEMAYPPFEMRGTADAR